MYVITRQSNYYDEGAYSVEIAKGMDNVSPGAFGNYYNGDFSESPDPREAADFAITLRKEWTRDNRASDLSADFEVIPFTISGASSMGLYPTVADGLTAAGLRRWAKAVYEKMPKCDKCGDPCEAAENYRDEYGEPFTACSDSCAARYVEDEAEFQAQWNVENDDE